MGYVDEIAMSDDAHEKLFLLEFLVESVYIYKGCARDIGAAEWMMLGPSAVAFQFMSFPALDIVESELPAKGCPTTEPQTFESGKSCLFSLPEALLRNAPGEFVIHVHVSKRLPPGCSSDTFPVGTSTIDLTNEFFTVVSDIFNSPNEIPATASRRDRFIIIGNKTNRPVGQIHLYIRLSCFGKLITTQFTLASGKSYLFKGDADQLFKCHEVEPNLDRACLMGSGGRGGGSGGGLSNLLHRGGGGGGSCTPRNAPTPVCGGGASVPPGPNHPCGVATTVEECPSPACPTSDVGCGPSACPGSNVACYKIAKESEDGGTIIPSSALEAEKCTTTAEPYVLRVGKRCSKGCDEKEQLELELRAPPQRYRDSKETQWEKDPYGKKKKKKKKKGKKGKKGKKKKK